MTEQHECVWELKSYLYVGVPIFGCKVDGCHAKLAVGQAETRLNEYETLKELEKACIRLYVGEITKPAWREFVRRSPEGQRLIALASSEEGKDETGS